MIAAAPHSLRVAALSVNAINIGKATGDHSPHSPFPPLAATSPAGVNDQATVATRVGGKRILQHSARCGKPKLRVLCPYLPLSACCYVKHSLNALPLAALRCGRFCGTV